MWMLKNNLEKEDRVISVVSGTGLWLGKWRPGLRITYEPGDMWNENEKNKNNVGHDIFLLILSLSIAIFVRIYRFSDPFVVFKEAVVGNEINHYFGGRFFVTKTPPLFQLLFYMIAKYLLKYNGSTAFQPLSEIPYAYPQTPYQYPYMAMRFVNVLLGVAPTMLTYSILRYRCKTRARSAFLGSLAIALENSYVTNQRLASADNGPFCLFVVTTYLWMNLEQDCRAMPWSPRWLGDICAVSVCCGLLCACNRQGGSAMLAVITIYAVYRFWWNNAILPIGRSFSALLCQVSLYILSAIVFFTGICMVHLQLTPHSGDGDRFLSGSFQAMLDPDKALPTIADVSYSSFVTIRQAKLGGYLHSHHHYYPQGSRQQQVSLYEYRDMNNVWIVEPPIGAGKAILHRSESKAKFEQEANDHSSLSSGYDTGAKIRRSESSKTPGFPVGFRKKAGNYTHSQADALHKERTDQCPSETCHGFPEALRQRSKPHAEETVGMRRQREQDNRTHGYQYLPFRPLHFSNETVLRLNHASTGKRLHSHAHPPLVSDVEWQLEVSAYGAEGYPGDVNDLWVLEVENDASQNGLLQKQWQALASIVRFRHLMTGCYLFAHRIRLPQWGFRQFEVTCELSGIRQNTLWYVESNFHPETRNRSKTLESVSYRPISLAEKYIEYVDAMSVFEDELMDEDENLASRTNINGNPRQAEILFLPSETTLYAAFPDGRQIILFGNPVVWYGCLLAMLWYAMFRITTAVSLQKGAKITRKLGQWKAYDHFAGRFFLAWMINYLFAVFLPATKTISDYACALYLSVLLCIVSLDNFLLRVNGRCMGIVLIMAVVCGFAAYSPLAWGTTWKTDMCNLFNFGGWQFQCEIYSHKDIWASYGIKPADVRSAFEKASYQDELRKFRPQPTDDKYVRQEPEDAIQSSISEEWSRVTPPPILGPVDQEIVQASIQTGPSETLINSEPEV